MFYYCLTLLSLFHRLTFAFLLLARDSRSKLRSPLACSSVDDAKLLLSQKYDVSFLRGFIPLLQYFHLQVLFFSGLHAYYQKQDECNSIVFHHTHRIMLFLMVIFSAAKVRRKVEGQLHYSSNLCAPIFQGRNFKSFRWRGRNKNNRGHN